MAAEASRQEVVTAAEPGVGATVGLEPCIPLEEVILAESLGPGPSVYHSHTHEVELELQDGSLEDEVRLPVKVAASLQFVECGMEGSGRWDE